MAQNTTFDSSGSHTGHSIRKQSFPYLILRAKFREGTLDPPSARTSMKKSPALVGVPEYEISHSDLFDGQGKAAGVTISRLRPHRKSNSPGPGWRSRKLARLLIQRQTNQAEVALIYTPSYW